MIVNNLEFIFKKKFKIEYLIIGITILIILGDYLYTHNPFDKSLKTQTYKENPAVTQAQKIFNSCQSQDINSCYPKAFQDLTKKVSMKFAMDTLNSLQDMDIHAQGCHLIAHYIAKAETEKNPSKWKDLIQTMNPNACSGGYIHGVLEAHSYYDKSFQLNAKNLADICGFVGQFGKFKDAESSCDHIMGHLMLVEKGGFINDAIDECSQTPQKYNYGCDTGVFMENLTRDNLSVHKIGNPFPWDEGALNYQHKLCQDYSGDAQVACWRETAHLLVQINNHDPLKIFDGCRQAPNTKAFEECSLHSVDIMSTSAFTSDDNLKYMCSAFPDEEGLKSCMNRFLASTLGSTVKFILRVSTFCNSFDDTHTKECYKMVSDRLTKLVSKSEKEKLCSIVPPNYRNVCQGS